MGCELAPGRGVSLREMAVIGQSRGVGPQLGAPGCCQQGGVRAQTWGGMVWGGRDMAVLKVPGPRVN